MEKIDRTKNRIKIEFKKALIISTIIFLSALNLALVLQLKNEVKLVIFILFIMSLSAGLISINTGLVSLRKKNQDQEITEPRLDEEIIEEIPFKNIVNTITVFLVKRFKFNYAELMNSY
jgi:NADH:ubiquinone oxidoreductase subunit K